MNHFTIKNTQVIDTDFMHEISDRICARSIKACLVKLSNAFSACDVIVRRLMHAHVTGMNVSKKIAMCYVLVVTAFKCFIVDFKR